MSTRVVVVVAACVIAVPVCATAQGSEPFRPFEADAYRLVNSIAFSPDGSEMYYALLAREVQAHRGQSAEGAPEVGMYRSVWDGSGWSEPELVPFTGAYHTYEPTISPDGTVMVFNSARPWDDGRIPEKNDLWVSERSDGEWGNPRRIAEISTFDGEESYGALSADGMLVFLKEVRTAGESAFDLYESRYIEGRFAPPVRHPVSSDRWGEGDPWLSSDGRILIFTRWDDRVGWAETVDLYISVRDAAGWSEPVPINELNTDGADFGVAASPDDRWLYYKNGSNFMRVSMQSIIEAYENSPAPGP